MMEAEKLLEMAKAAGEEAEVYQVSSRRTPVKFESNHLKQIRTQESTLTALRLVKEGKIGFASASGEVPVEKILDMAVGTSQFGAKANFTFPSADTYPDVKTFDSETDKIALESMVGAGESLIAALVGHTPEISCEVDVVKAFSTVRLLNSRGADRTYSRTVFGIGVEGLVVNGTDMLFVGDGESSCSPVLDPTVVTGRVIRQLELAKCKAPVATRSMPVVFTAHGVASCLIAPLANAFNGKMVLEGASPLKGRLGEVVFDKNLFLYEDTTVPCRPSSRPYDDEGIASRKNTLIDAGKANCFLYDLQTAALAGAASTSSAIRHGGGQPSPSASCLMFAEGGVSFEDMVRSIKEGLVVEQVIGATQGNVLAGDFSGNVVLGYKVENGEIVGRVKDTMISGNVYEVLKQLDGIGSEGRWVDGSLFTPPLLCGNLSVSARDGGK